MVQPTSAERAPLPQEGRSPDDAKRQVARAAGVVSLATLVSRLAGFVRDVIIAKVFGAAMLADAFFVAFAIPSLLRRLFAEGALSAAFVPVFSSYLRSHSEAETRRLVAVALGAQLLVLLAVTGLGILLSPYLVTIFVPGFYADAEKFALTVRLTRLMFPFILFIGIAVLFMGVLNARQHFLTPALAPLMLNLGIIGSALWLTRHLDTPVLALGVGVLAGGLGQLLLQMPPLYRCGLLVLPRLSFRHPGLRRIWSLVVPTIVGLSAMQVNLMVDRLLASFLPEGSISYLYYANRLVQFPLGAFGAALGVAVLPTMASQASAGAIDQLKATLNFGLRLTFFVSVPATLALIILGAPIMNVLFERGAFGAQATSASAFALSLYAVGLCAYSGIKIATPVYYALHDSATPVKLSLIAMGTNVVLNLALMGPLRHGGLALATSLASFVNLFLLLLLLRRRLGSIDGHRLLRSTARVSLASLIMAAALWWGRAALFGPDLALGVKVVVVVGLSSFGLAVFCALSYAFKCEELDELLRIFRRRHAGTFGKGS